ncbi:MAG: response regulator transcription factor [Lachnospiraceae bacterium]|nr:response regulator transcription factor [Lachnospiraceae bacterium]
MAKKKILIIDDDLQIGNLEQEVLEQAGYSCSRAYSGTEALLLLEKEQPDLILLDLMLPGLSGEDVLKGIQEIPVVVVSAKVSVDDKVNLLLAGAQDYITKPFSTRELLARVEVQLRKNKAVSGKKLTAGDIIVDETARMAQVCGKPLSLTKTEYAILKVLVQNPGQVIAKSVILDRVSEEILDCTESSLKTHISHLRSKLRSVSEKDYIESVWGIGFKLNAD